MTPSVSPSRRSDLGTSRATGGSRQRAQRELTPERRSDPVLDEVARSLRAARARTGMSETQVVAVLAEQGFKITVTRLRGWERTGVIRVDAAAQLANAYGITIDSLAGRRAYRSIPGRSPASGE